MARLMQPNHEIYGVISTSLPSQFLALRSLRFSPGIFPRPHAATGRRYVRVALPFFIWMTFVCAVGSARFLSFGIELGNLALAVLIAASATNRIRIHALIMVMSYLSILWDQGRLNHAISVQQQIEVRGYHHRRQQPNCVPSHDIAAVYYFGFIRPIILSHDWLSPVSSPSYRCRKLLKRAYFALAALAFWVAAPAISWCIQSYLPCCVSALHFMPQPFTIE